MIDDKYLHAGAYNPEVVVLEMRYLFMKNYNYLIIDPQTRFAVIVDPAWQMENIDQALRDSNALLKGVLLTHSHADHIHLAGAVAKKYHCPVWMSHEEIAFSGYHTDGLIAIDAEPFAVGEMLIQPLHTPGHTPGCFCYLIGDNLFSGDVLFAEGCGVCSDLSAAHLMFASLGLLKNQLGPNTRIFPGHSYGKTPGQLFSLVLKENIYLQFKSKEHFAAYRLRKGQDKSKMFTFQ